MCLLFFKPAAVRFTDAQLTDMYVKNPDGFGVMFARDNVLHISKNLGSVHDWIEFHRKYEHVDACWHTRMKTHGNIDLENAHPYPVYGFDAAHPLPVAMMHNGVLHTGNRADTTKSDTWHYIRSFLHPLTAKDPDVIFSPEFNDVISKHIGSSNKFAFMDSKGRVQIINKSAGIEWGGAWFSNTYAWSAYNETLYPGIMEGRQPPTTHWNTKYDSHFDSTKYYSQPKTAALPNKTKPTGTKKVKAGGKVVGKVEGNVSGKPADSTFMKTDVNHLRTLLREECPSTAEKLRDSDLRSLIYRFGVETAEDLAYYHVDGSMTQQDFVRSCMDSEFGHKMVNKMYLSVSGY